MVIPLHKIHAPSVLSASWLFASRDDVVDRGVETGAALGVAAGVTVGESIAVLAASTSGLVKSVEEDDVDGGAMSRWAMTLAGSSSEGMNASMAVVVVGGAVADDDGGAGRASGREGGMIVGVEVKEETEEEISGPECAEFHCCCTS